MVKKIIENFLDILKLILIFKFIINLLDIHVRIRKYRNKAKI